MTLLYILVTSLYFVASIAGFVLVRILDEDKAEFNFHIVLSALMLVIMMYSILGGN
ncbi:hypothetical protein Riggi_50 [Bacillus phage Riggi]|uniref:Uncharacterized protein n=1 Tax=Bacillus phage Riggi TaxID=2884426 RepID=U5PZX8_9CAUD|nr:hypothetical protein Riggi_50 [Bacillus phage Riggi]AGY48212.1 hypothetical protein Riggi_50 [Bacillus phage Riggi]